VGEREPERPEVGRPRAVVHAAGQSLEAAVPDHLEPATLGARCGVLVQENRYVHDLRDVFADAAGEGRRIGHRRLAKRYEGHDIEGADARMHAGMPPQIDASGGLLRKRDNRVFEGGRVPDERQHRAVVRRVGRAVEQADGVDRGDRVGERRDDRLVSSLADVGDALEQRHVRGSA
jgi:hypothetical protein